MEKFADIIRKAAELCLQKRVPFCVYAFPGKDADVVFFSNPSGRQLGGRRRFVVGRWNEKYDRAIEICEELDADETLAFFNELPINRLSGLEPWKETTRYDEYECQLTELIATIRREGLGKVVLSKTCSKKHELSMPELLGVVERLFGTFPNSFRSLYYTPQTGAWMGASPELLVNYDSRSGQLATMALAGTRPAEKHRADEKWSAKDIEEQAIVTEYLSSKLTDIGFWVKCSAPHTLTTGDLQHICTDITATYPKTTHPSAAIVVDAINPTPALCGFPKQRAEELIARHERHPRNCYGGFIGVINNSTLQAFVNLRCAHFDLETVCIYAGGGILSQSEVESEWNEAERKSSAIGRFFQ